jgi:uridine kinase
MSNAALTAARDRVISAVRRRQNGRHAHIVVALDGPSGSGKSTLARAIAEEIAAVVVPVDDFFAAHIPDAGWDARSAEARARDVFDWPRLRREAVEPLREGKTARWHAFDFEAGVLPDGTYGMSSDWVSRDPAPVVLLDGAYSAGPQLADLVDLTVLVDAPEGERRARLEAREDPHFLEAWHARWDAAEAHYFTRVRPPSAYDLIVTTSSEDACSREGAW